MFGKICNATSFSIGRFNRYEKAVTFKIRNKNRCINFFGGCFTITVITLLLVYGVLLFIQCLKRTDLRIGQTIERSFNENSTTSTKFTDFDSIMFKLSLYEVQYDTSLSSKNIKRSISVEVLESNGKKLTDIFPQVISKECNTIFEKSEANAVKSWCFNLKGIDLNKIHQGTSENSGIIFRIYYCLNSSDNVCTDPAQRRLIPLHFKADLRVQSKYIDLSDIKEPIKLYTDKIDQWKFHPDIRYQSTYYIERQELYLEDSIFPALIEPEPIKFNRICDQQRSQAEYFHYENTDNNKVLYSTIIKLSPDTIGKHSLVELIGIVGGIFEIFEVTFALLFGILYSYYFRISLDSEFKKHMHQFGEIQQELQKLKVVCQQNSQQLGKSATFHHPLKQEFDPIFEESKNEALTVEENHQRSKIRNDLYRKCFLNQSESAALPKQDRSQIQLEEFLEGGQPHNDSELAKNLVKVSSTSSDAINSFYKERDCLSVLFRIKILEVKVAYLVNQDLEYAESVANSKVSNQLKRKQEEQKYSNPRYREKVGKVDNSFHQLLEDIPPIESLASIPGSQFRRKLERNKTNQANPHLVERTNNFDDFTPKRFRTQSERKNKSPNAYRTEQYRMEDDSYL
ncbi:unnamed protein product [Moneuplotes crassus]|uniref:Uncharacterized protein n=1 Tax=Euplotes crassus TaxID=5936 RepID=A0AAD1YA85_EUPCR|nr:unnamed protein product [Moneuplotes crassus]